jgi:hypothetical protein
MQNLLKCLVPCQQDATPSVDRSVDFKIACIFLVTTVWVLWEGDFYNCTALRLFMPLRIIIMSSLKGLACLVIVVHPAPSLFVPSSKGRAREGLTKSRKRKGRKAFGRHLGKGWDCVCCMRHVRDKLKDNARPEERKAHACNSLVISSVACLSPTSWDILFRETRSNGCCSIDGVCV